MQNDLISRSALIEEIESLTMQITGLSSGKGVLSEWMKEYKKSVLKTIEEQPTAYDVEKVVAELEELRTQHKFEMILFGSAVEIVRNGGKE